MFVILIAAASLLSQAYLFRDLDRSDSNVDVNSEAAYRDSAYVRAAAYVSSDKSDSSRTK